MTRRALPAATLVAGQFVSALPAEAQQANWQELPRLELQQMFAGPFRDTIIQRLRDPDDGTICYIYLPMSAPHTPPTSSGYVEYGAATIGSISCVPGTAARQRAERVDPRLQPPEQ